MAATERSMSVLLDRFLDNQEDSTLKGVLQVQAD
jgi:hypothetical protein